MDNPFDRPVNSEADYEPSAAPTPSPETTGAIYHRDLMQGSDSWLAIRRGVLTASEVKHILTPTTLKFANNEKMRGHVYEIAAQRISGYVEPSYVSDDMLRGQEDEIDACIAYEKAFGLTDTCGFITRDFGGFTIGYSPDRLVGEDGLIECKSRRQKFQVEVFASGEVPTEHLLQCQTGLLVTGRAWLDYVSYSGGLPMAVLRVLPDERVQSAILEAAQDFEARVQTVVADYTAALRTIRNVPTKRRIIQEMIVG